MINLPIFNNLILACQCYEPQRIMVCLCPNNEKAIRAYSKQDGMGKAFGIPPPMTPEQREWCLSEIDSVEGYDRKDHELDEDSDLTRTVLSAWTDYCRDKGMI